VTALRPARRDQRLVRASELVEIVQDHRALDQRLAVIEHQRRHPPQRIVRRDFVGIAKGRPRPVFECDAVQPRRDGDTADEGGGRIGRSGSWALMIDYHQFIWDKSCAYASATSENRVFEPRKNPTLRGPQS